MNGKITEERKKEMQGLIRKLIEDSRDTFVSAVAEDGWPTVKAMFTTEWKGMDVFWFSSNVSAKRTQMFLKNAKACVYFCDQPNFTGLSMEGEMKVRTDREARAALWKEGDEQYYPEGVDDPDYCVLEFRPIRGRFYCGKSGFYGQDLSGEDLAAIGRIRL